MLANAGALLAAAAVLFVGCASLTTRLWDGPGRRAAALAILLLPWLLGAAMPPAPVATTHPHGFKLIPAGVAGMRS
jgi:hypothetical protein